MTKYRIHGLAKKKSEAITWSGLCTIWNIHYSSYKPVYDFKGYSLFRKRMLQDQKEIMAYVYFQAVNQICKGERN